MATTRRIVTEVCPATGLNRVRMQRRQDGPGVSIMGTVMADDRRYYLDGAVVHPSPSAQGPGWAVVEQRWEAVPTRTDDVLDFGRLAMAATRLVQQMASHDPGNPASPTQVAVYAQAYGNLQRWRKEAEAKFVGADGQIDMVATVLRGLLP